MISQGSGEGRNSNVGIGDTGAEADDIAREAGMRGTH